MVNAVIAERAPEAVKAVADGGARGALPLLRHGRHSGAAFRRGGARQHRALHDASGKGLGPQGGRLALPARHLAQRDARGCSPRRATPGTATCSTTTCPMCGRFGDRKIVAIPLGTDVNDMPFMKYGNAPRTMLELFTENLAIARETDELTMIDVTCHAHIFGHPRGAYYYGKIIEAAAAANDVWIGTRAADRPPRARAKGGVMGPFDHDDDPHAEIRDGVRRLCADFPGEYWRKLDDERAYPARVRRGGHQGGLSLGADPGGIRRLRPAARRRRGDPRGDPARRLQRRRLPRPDVHHGRAAPARQRRRRSASTCRRSPPARCACRRSG